MILKFIKFIKFKKGISHNDFIFNTKIMGNIYKFFNIKIIFIKNISPIYNIYILIKIAIKNIKISLIKLLNFFKIKDNIFKLEKYLK